MTAYQIYDRRFGSWLPVDEFGRAIVGNPEPPPAPSPRRNVARLLLADMFHPEARKKGITYQSFRKALNRQDEEDVDMWQLIFDGTAGGDMETAWDIETSLGARCAPKVGVALGGVSSAATIPYLACDRRLVHPTCGFFMLHKPHLGGKQPANKNEREILDAATKKLLDFYTSKLPVPRSRIAAWMQNSTYFDANEAVEFGLAHALLNPLEWDPPRSPRASLAGKNRPTPISADDAEADGNYTDADLALARKWIRAAEERGRRREGLPA